MKKQEQRDTVEITRDPNGKVKYVVINGNMIWDHWRRKNTDCCICKDDPDNMTYINKLLEQSKKFGKMNGEDRDKYQRAVYVLGGRIGILTSEGEVMRWALNTIVKWSGEENEPDPHHYDDIKSIALDGLNSASGRLNDR